MKFIPRKLRLEHATPFWVSNPDYFVTICCLRRGFNQLCRPEVVQVIFQSAHTYQVSHRWYCELLVLMPDHMHLILSVGETKKIADVVGTWKRWVAKKVGTQFQNGFFDHRLRGAASAQEKWDYVNLNPVRKGLVSRVEDWPYRWTGKELSAGSAISAGDLGDVAPT